LRRKFGERAERPSLPAAPEEVPEAEDDSDETSVKRAGGAVSKPSAQGDVDDGQPVPVEQEEKPQEARPQRRKMGERPLRRQRAGGVREAEEEEGTESRRPSRRGIGAAEQKPLYMQPPVWIGAGTAVLVLVILLIANAGGKPQAVPPPQDNQQAEFDAATQIYNDAYSMYLARKSEALPKVKAAREIYQKLVDKYPNAEWIVLRFTNLNTWEKQLGEVEFARENNARREGR
jgi:hypothetical protein